MQDAASPVPVTIRHFQEDSEQELGFFSMCGGDHDIGPRVQTEEPCQVILGFTVCTLGSVSEWGKKGGRQSLPELPELEDTGSS